MSDFVATRLVKARELRGLSQGEVAQALDMVQSQYNRYEKGGTEIKAGLLARVCKILNVNPAYILGLTDDPLGHITEADLTDEERELVSAFRSGDQSKVVDALTTMNMKTKSRHG